MLFLSSIKGVDLIIGGIQACFCPRNPSFILSELRWHVHLLARIDLAHFTFPYQRKRWRPGLRLDLSADAPVGSYLLKSLPIFLKPLIINVCKILVIVRLFLVPWSAWFINFYPVIWRKISVFFGQDSDRDFSARPEQPLSSIRGQNRGLLCNFGNN